MFLVAGGGAGAGAGDFAAVLSSAVATAVAAAVNPAVQKAFKEREDADAQTFLSPTGQQYERLAENQVDDWLLKFCGLRILSSAKRRLAATDPSAKWRQWDARFLITVEPAWQRPQKDAFRFFVYGGSDYTPPVVINPRKLSPYSPKAQYYAVMEYTAYDGWFETWTSESGKQRKNLLPRLEQRLEVVKQRVGAAGSSVSNICDIVAVVGVAGSFPCDVRVEEILSAPAAAITYPLLTAMFNAHRFVFFQFSAVAPSPKVVSSATGNAAAGGMSSAAAAVTSRSFAIGRGGGASSSRGGSGSGSGGSGSGHRGGGSGSGGDSSSRLGAHGHNRPQQGDKLQPALPSQ